MSRRVNVCGTRVEHLRLPSASHRVEAQSWGGSTGRTALHTPKGSGSDGGYGDDVTSDEGVEDPHRYLIEVPLTLSRLLNDSASLDG